MSVRQNPNPPVDCDVCGLEITTILGGNFLDCVTVDLHDGSPVKDVCGVCIGLPLTEICPHILARTVGNKLRPVPPASAGVDLGGPKPADQPKGTEG